jgi:hypothetical protein
MAARRPHWEAASLEECNRDYSSLWKDYGANSPVTGMVSGGLHMFGAVNVI